MCTWERPDVHQLMCDYYYYNRVLEHDEAVGDSGKQQQARDEEAVAQRRKLLRLRWRGVARATGPLIMLLRRSSERVYALGGPGYQEARASFLSSERLLLAAQPTVTVPATDAVTKLTALSGDALRMIAHALPLRSHSALASAASSLNQQTCKSVAERRAEEERCQLGRARNAILGRRWTRAGNFDVQLCLRADNTFKLRYDEYPPGWRRESTSGTRSGTWRLIRGDDVRITDGVGAPSASGLVDGLGLQHAYHEVKPADAAAGCIYVELEVRCTIEEFRSDCGDAAPKRKESPPGAACLFTTLFALGSETESDGFMLRGWF